MDGEKQLIIVTARDRLRSAGLDAVRPAVDRALATSGLTVRHAGAYAPTRQEI